MFVGIVRDLNLGQNCIAVIMDLGKAFDTVHPAKLLNILGYYSIRRIVLKLIWSYRFGRTQ